MTAMCFAETLLAFQIMRLLFWVVWYFWRWDSQDTVRSTHV